MREPFLLVMMLEKILNVVETLKLMQRYHDSPIAPVMQLAGAELLESIKDNGDDVENKTTCLYNGSCT